MKKMLLVFLLFSGLSHLMAQERVVKGSVTDDKNAPIGDVSIIVKGTNTGTVTTADGAFTIKMPAGKKILVFSSVGMQTREVDAGNQSTLKVALSSNNAELQEVVVLGYQSVSKKEVIGAVSTISGAEVSQKPITNFTQLLQGKATGLQVTSQSGRPGQPATLRVRGAGSINASSDPLIVLDGVPIPQAAFNMINPNDIDNFTVLKDAASSSIYGARGANGVVVITTKRGKAKPELRYSFQYGMSEVQPLKNMQLMNSRQKLQYEYEGQYTNGLLDTMINNRIASGTFPSGSTLQSITEAQRTSLWDLLESRGVGDWSKLLFNKAIIKTHELALSGSGDKFRYFFSLNKSDNEGIMYGSYWNRTGGRMNIEFSPTSWFKVGTNLGVTFTKDNQVREAFNTQNSYAGYFLINPYEPALLPNGQYNTTLQGFNPIEGTVNNPQEFKRMSGFATIYGEGKFIRNVTVKSQLGINYNTMHEEYYIQPGSNLANILGYNNKRVQSNQDYLYVFTNTINWRANLNENHTVSILGGTEFTKDRVYNILLQARGFPSASVNTLDNAATPFQTSTARADWSLISYFANASYDYKKKYFVNVTGRRDGSSRFGADVKFANFWGVGASWNILAENLIKWNVLSTLSLKASYGTAGNNNIGNYDALGTYALNARYNNQGAAVPARLPNPALTWETNENYDLGIEAGFFNNRLNAKVDYYNRQTNDLLYPVNVSATTGFASFTGNIGGMRNRGIELEVNGDIIKNKDLTWNLGISYSNNDNKVTKLYNDDQAAANTSALGRLKVGEAVNTFYLIPFAGVNPVNGKDRFIKKDGTITEAYSASDAVLLSGKSPNVKFFGSVNTRINYKDFDLSAQIYYSGGNYIFNAMWQTAASNGENINVPQLVESFDYWKKAGDVAAHPNLNDPSQRVTFNDDRWLQKGDYVSLRDVTLGYTVSPALLKKQNVIKSLRLFAQGTNLWIGTKFKGMPEVGNANGENLTQSGVLTLFAYPPVTAYTFGIDVRF
jgi:TonB-linked SusC/RagA family outer membrane protein